MTKLIEDYQDGEVFKLGEVRQGRPMTKLLEIEELRHLEDVKGALNEKRLELIADRANIEIQLKLDRQEANLAGLAGGSKNHEWRRKAKAALSYKEAEEKEVLVRLAQINKLIKGHNLARQKSLEEERLKMEAFPRAFVKAAKLMLPDETMKKLSEMAEEMVKSREVNKRTDEAAP